jgi:hypothetical protein
MFRQYRRKKLKQENFMRNQLIKISSALAVAAFLATPAFALGSAFDEDAAAPLGSFTSDMTAPVVHVKADAVQQTAQLPAADQQVASK